MSLNSAQSEAVETLSGAMLVLAGAGTGKTRVVTYRIARLIQSGVMPSRILAVTFTNKAARELQSRISELLKKTNVGFNNKEGGKPEATTFHSLCVRILRRHINCLGYPNQFAIYDRGDQESVARRVLREIKVSDAALRPAELLSRISSWKSGGVTCDLAIKSESAMQSPKGYLAAVAYARYQESLRTLGAVDFDDLLLLTEQLLCKNHDVLLAEAGRFDHILVDEYQDTNLSQYRIVRELALSHGNLCVVGDDDQAIYGWRGAEVTHILNFKKDWRDAKIVRLEENYRSTREIVGWANNLIRFNVQRHGKSLRSCVSGLSPVIRQCKDGDVEAKFVADDVLRVLKSGVKAEEVAVLFRTNEQPRLFEMEFRSARIPYVLVGGQSFFDRKEVRDLLSYLKLMNRFRDEVSLLRILNTPPRGIGAATVQRLTERSIELKIPIWESISRLKSGGEGNEELGVKTIEALDSFQELIECQRNILSRDFSVENLRGMIQAVDYGREIERQYQEEKERNERWESVGEILSAASKYILESSQPTLSGFLDDALLSGNDFGSNQEVSKRRNQAVILMTLHAAKGLEFSDVYMVGMEEGILPHYRSVDSDDVLAVDEERRLCYVGITRAKKRLTLTLALNRMKWGKMRPTIPSRFLYEITGQADNPNYRRAINGDTPAR
ncbi:MAG: UvrD-helicase domain-containing protein [Planctomycetaceae bacterium]|jgi:DNA helicase-2/ATP-dependent DNA helicase PcrA|nr:UvrD-helicase domain-containing protein [Planctomycetaceae bacterium]